MVKVIRVDDKLCHGRVTYSWIRKMDIEELIIADDRVVNDNFGQMILKLSKPVGVEQQVVAVDDAIQYIKSREAKKRKIFLLVGSVESAYRIVGQSAEIREINLGAIREHPGSKSYTRFVYLDEEELEWCKNMLDRGLSIDMRMAFDDPRVSLLQFM